jgi:4-amino-4-deoxy-L-arabinose transferase-like glycosyltransferase
MKQKGLEIFFKFWNNYFIFSLVLILILIKVSYLQIPFYWDEAWSYAMAIFDMANHGPTLIPGHANEWFTRGHPLFFYFIASSWLVIFGKSVVSAHIFALLISCLSLYLIHFCCRKLFSVSIANIVAITLMSQIMFIAQSTLLLPEIFLMGLSVWVFYLYFQKKMVGF